MVYPLKAPTMVQKCGNDFKILVMLTLSTPNLVDIINKHQPIQLSMHKPHQLYNTLHEAIYSFNTH